MLQGMKDIPFITMTEVLKKIQGKLHIFYERPLLLYVQGSYNQEQQITIDGHFEWKISRGIGEIPSYMFPEIQEKKYLKFDSII